METEFPNNVPFYILAINGFNNATPNIWVAAYTEDKYPLFKDHMKQLENAWLNAHFGKSSKISVCPVMTYLISPSHSFSHLKDDKRPVVPIIEVDNGQNRIQPFAIQKDRDTLLPYSVFWDREFDRLLKDIDEYWLPYKGLTLEPFINKPRAFHELPLNPDDDVLTPYLEYLTRLGEYCSNPRMVKIKRSLENASLTDNELWEPSRHDLQGIVFEDGTSTETHDAGWDLERDILRPWTLYTKTRVFKNRFTKSFMIQMTSKRTITVDE